MRCLPSSHSSAFTGSTFPPMGNDPASSNYRRFSLRNRARQRRGVAPDQSAGEGVNVLEIRPGRWLCIRHFPGHNSRQDQEEDDNNTTCNVGRDQSSTGTCSNGTVPAHCATEKQCTGTSNHSRSRKDNSERHVVRGGGNKVSPGNNSAENQQPVEIERDPNAITSGSMTFSEVSNPQQQQQPRLQHNDSINSVNSVTPQIKQTSKWSSQVSLVSLMEEPGSVLFFFHGVGGSGDVWHHQIRYFSKVGMEMVVPDMLGHGFSRAPRKTSAYKFEELAADLLSIFDRYAKKRNVLIGHSYGGSLCTVIAKERSRKVTKLVLLSNGGPIPLSPEPCHLFCLPACCLACIKPLIDRTFVRQAFHSQSTAGQPTSSSAGAADRQVAFDVPAYVLRATMQGQYWPEGGCPYHASLPVAVLLLHGRQDQLVTQEETELMQETIYASQLELIESAGHMVMVEQPQRVNELLHAFILKDMTIIRALQPSHVTNHVTTGDEGHPAPSLHRHKTVPHISMTS